MANRARIEDICERLQLSKATVSKALNGYDSVREETRARVLACEKVEKSSKLLKFRLGLGKDGERIQVACYGRRYYDSAVKAHRNEIIIFRL